MKKLTLVLVLGLFLLNTPVFAQCGPNAKINKTLSDYLVAQGFRFGLSRAEALEHYSMDKNNTEYRGLVNSKLRNQGPYNHDPIKVGFYAIELEKGQVVGLNKCVALSEGLSSREAIDAFKNKYRINKDPSWGVCHLGRSLGVRLKVLGGCVVVEVSDFTNQIKEEQEEQNKKSRGVNRLKDKL